MYYVDFLFMFVVELLIKIIDILFCDMSLLYIINMQDCNFGKGMVIYKKKKLKQKYEKYI